MTGLPPEGGDSLMGTSGGGSTGLRWNMLAIWETFGPDWLLDAADRSISQNTVSFV